MRLSILDEKVITMREQNAHKISEELLSQYENLIRNDRLNKLPNDLPCINLTISYDMGWQKRSGGRVYDLLSGH